MINYCYNIADVTATGTESDGAAYVGGLIGSMNDTVNTKYGYSIGNINTTTGTFGGVIIGTIDNGRKRRKFIWYKTEPVQVYLFMVAH